MLKLKRKITLLTIAMAAIYVLTGCNGKVENHGLNPKEPTTIVIWHYYNGVQDIELNKMIKEFNNTVGAEKGIIVRAESKSSITDLTEEVENSANKKVGAQELPDMFQCYLDMAVDFDELGLFADLDQYVSETEKAEYIPAYIEEGTFGSKEQWKLFPIAKSTEVMALNKTAWDEFAKDTGVSAEKLATWEGVAEVAGEYYKWSGGKSFFGRDAFANYMIIGSRQLGCELFQVENGEVTVQLDEKIMKRLWDNYYVPYIKGYFKNVGRYRTDDVKTGEIIALVGSTSGMMYFPNEVTIGEGEPQKIDYMILPLPNFEGTQKFAVQQGAGIGVVKSTETREYASTVFLKWFTEADRNFTFSVQSGYLPVKIEANHMDSVKENLENQETVLSGIQKDTLYTAMEEVNEGELYTTAGFKGATNARKVIEESMRNLAEQDRESILKEVEKGMAETEASKYYLSQEHFAEWLQNLHRQLKETI